MAGSNGEGWNVTDASYWNDQMRTDFLRTMRRWTTSLAIVGLLVTGFTPSVEAATSDGHVIGSLRMSPGTAVTVTVARAGLPMSGRVVFKPEHGREKVLRVGTSGQFNVTLREGVYTAFGGGTGWFPNCRGNAGKSFRIVAGHTLKVVVWCVAL